MQIVMAPADPSEYPENAESITLPGFVGEMMVCEGHEPFCVVLKAGTIKVNGVPVTDITGGIALIRGHRVLVLIERGENGES